MSEKILDFLTQAANGNALEAEQTFKELISQKVQDRLEDIRADVMSNEEVEIDEAIKLGSKVLIHKGPKDVIGKTGIVGEIRKGLYKGAPKTYTVDHNKGSIQLGKEHIKLVKENEEFDEETLDELSKKTLGSYVNKSTKDIANKEFNASTDISLGKKGRALDRLNSSEKRQKGISAAVKKLTKENAELMGLELSEETLDELSKKTIGSYIGKALTQATDMDKRAKQAKDDAEYVRAFERSRKNPPKKGKIHTLPPAEFSDDIEKRASRKRDKRLAGIHAASRQLTKENAELMGLELSEEELDELSKKTLSSYLGKANKHLRNAEIIDPEKHQNRVLGIRRAVGKYNKRKD